MSKNDRLEVFENIELVFRKYGADLIENRPRLLGLLKDYGYDYDGEVRLLMIAFDEGIPRRFLSKEIFAADIKLEARNFAVRTGLDPEVAKKTINTWLAISELLRAGSVTGTKAIDSNDVEFIGLDNKKDDSWVVPLINSDTDSNKQTNIHKGSPTTTSRLFRAIVFIILIVAGSSYFFRENLLNKVDRKELDSPVETPIATLPEHEGRSDKDNEKQGNTSAPDKTAEPSAGEPKIPAPVRGQDRGLMGYAKLSITEPLPAIKALRPDNKGEGLILKFSLETEGQVFSFLSYIVYPQNGRAGGLIELKNAVGGGTKTDLLLANMFQSGEQSYFSIGGALKQNIYNAPDICVVLEVPSDYSLSVLTGRKVGVYRFNSNGRCEPLLGAAVVQ